MRGFFWSPGFPTKVQEKLRERETGSPVCGNSATLKEGSIYGKTGIHGGIVLRDNHAAHCFV